MDRKLTRSQLNELADELRSECSRVERTLAPGEFSYELDALLQARQRIEDGTYGLCVDCARTIPFGRLQVMPATHTCVACAR